MNFSFLSRGLFLAASLFFLVDSPHAEIAIPALLSPVIDQSSTLGNEEQAQLDAEFRSYLPTLQLQLWIVPSLEGESIEGLSIRAVDKWKLGSEKTDRGALILIALKERQMRIEVGQGLEGEIPDIVAGRIVDAIMAPQFRRGDFFGGVTLAAREIYIQAGGDLSKIPQGQSRRQVTQKRPLGLFDFVKIFFALIFFFFLIMRFPLLGLLFLGGGRRGGGGHWGGGGGGGWSGGGGGFSGGGSSGSW